MKVHEFVRRSEMPAPATELFAWHTRPGAFRRLIPPWDDVRVVRAAERIDRRDRAVLSVPLAGPIRTRWVAEHDRYDEGRSFRDVQVAGPFALWEHTHDVEPVGRSASVLEDRIRYALPLGAIGDAIGGRGVRRRLERTFRFRHERTRLDLAAHARHGGGGSDRVLVSGASGLVGTELCAFLTSGGHRVVPLSRGAVSSDEAVRWSPEEGTIEAGQLGGFDAVVHLAGETVVGRWSAEKKRKILESRSNGTRLLCETLARLREKPRVLVCASATGFYGSRGDETLTEESVTGGGFLAGVCREWEAACEPARQAGIRVVNVRIGLVLTPRGGVLGTMLPVFRAGLGGTIGSGRQWMPWIAIDDLLDVLYAGVRDERLAGPVNATASNPVTNAEFTKVLARVLRRPAAVAVPEFALRAALGEAADETALAGARVLSVRLQERGHPFRYPSLEPALRFLLGRSGGDS